MAQERLGVHTLKGNPLTLIGPELKVGDKAPEFTVRSSLVDTKSSSDYKGKIRLINVVPSLYTGICDAQTRRFNEEAAKLGDQVAILTISVDLPSAQQQYCAAAGIDKVEVLSDHYDVSFGTAGSHQGTPSAGAFDLHHRRRGHDPLHSDQQGDGRTSGLRQRACGTAGTAVNREATQGSIIAKTAREANFSRSFVISWAYPHNP